MDNYIDEARSIFSAYRPLVADFVARMSDFMKREAAEPQVAALYPHGLDALRWIQEPDETPALEYMVTVPVCIPLVGLIQLMHVMVLYKTLGISPGELADRFQCKCTPSRLVAIRRCVFPGLAVANRDCLTPPPSTAVGATGHSQGLAVAAALALATTEDAFYGIARTTLGLLMLTGICPQMEYPPRTGAAASDAAQDGAAPTPMAVVLGLGRAQLAAAIDRHNARQTAAASRVYLSLVNGPRIFVVSGATPSLVPFVAALKREFGTQGADQTRVPFSQRKPGVAVRYLSINAPYHSPLLAHASAVACEHATRKGWLLDGRRLRRPLMATEDGREVCGVRNLSHLLLKSMITLTVDWPAAVTCPGATHVVDFGPGGVSGIGALVHRIHEGRGVSVISIGALESR
ncbi:fatty acid synthase alpha subunit Lsd1, partial [Coemansia nantahalensis]